MKSRLMQIRLLTFATMTFALAGCGLSEYEARMEKQRKRVKEFEELNKVLDDPIFGSPKVTIKVPPTPDMPKPNPDIQDVNAWPFDFYLRLPKGYGSRVEEKNKDPYGTAAGEKFPCYRFSSATAPETMDNYFVTAATKAEIPTKDVPLKESFGVYTPDNFRIYMQKAFEDYVFRNYKSKVTLTSQSTKPFEKDKEKGKPDKTKKEKVPAGEPVEIQEFSPLSPQHGVASAVQYERIVFTGWKNPTTRTDMAFVAYFAESGPKQFCVAILKKAENPKEDKGLPRDVDASLGTLDLTAENVATGNPGAVKRRNYYYKVKPP